METAAIKCPKCQTELRLHHPVMTRVDNAVMSQVTLCPSWSPSERVCPGCKSVVAPIIPDLKEIIWVVLEREQMPVPADEPSRIIKPGMQLPKDFPRKLKQA